MRFALPLAALAPLAAFVLPSLDACDGGGDQPPVSYCSSSSDCPGTMICAFLGAGGCDAQGECSAPPATACTPQPVCSCAGATVTACVVAGYALASPVRSLGACEGGEEVDSGASDAGGD